MNRFNEPLSIKFIHKPSRTQELFNKNLGDIKTLENSRTNINVGSGGSGGSGASGVSGVSGGSGGAGVRETGRGEEGHNRTGSNLVDQIVRVEKERENGRGEEVDEKDGKGGKEMMKERGGKNDRDRFSGRERVNTNGIENRGDKGVETRHGRFGNVGPFRNNIADTHTQSRGGIETGRERGRDETESDTKDPSRDPFNFESLTVSDTKGSDTKGSGDTDGGGTGGDHDTRAFKFFPEKRTAQDTFRHKLVRKKSGEIVKPNLKDHIFSHKVSKSLPTTPNIKQVHFGDGFDVKYFHKKDKPTAISASNSPTLESPDLAVQFSDNDSDSSIQSEEGDDYFNSRFADGPKHKDLDELLLDQDLLYNGSTSYPNPKHQNLIEWSLELNNFPKLSYDSKISSSSVLFLERIFISIDKKYLLGHIAVKNLSFEKNITLRYTFDDWQTIIEIPAVYVPDMPTILKINQYDRFIFKVPLNKMFNNYGNNLNYQKNRYSFCIRYTTHQQEYWDNNGGQNYQMVLTKKINSNSNSHTIASSSNYTASSPDMTASRPISRSNSGSSINSNFQQKPRYSSSYLRRRSSDSQLTNLDSDIDYVKNNFYLSSPLLSNLDQELVNLHSNTSTDTLTPNTNPNSNFNDSKQFDLKSLNSNLYNQDNFNSQSYKDLIDNYCFYTDEKSSTAGGATAGAISSDGSEQEQDQESVDSEEVQPTAKVATSFSISSLLGT